MLNEADEALLKGRLTFLEDKVEKDNVKLVELEDHIKTLYVGCTMIGTALEQLLGKAHKGI